MSERQPLKDPMSRAEVTEERFSIEDGICDRACRYLKILVCVGAALLIAYLIFAFIGGIDGKDYLPNVSNNNVKSESHEIGTDPFTNWQECDVSGQEPSVLAYHVHAVFDGNDKNSIKAAMNAYHSFINQFNPNMEQCSFSHSNSAVFQKELCYFPRNFDDDEFPMSSNKIFQSTNYAFYVPTSLLQQVMAWWMQHHSKTMKTSEGDDDETIISFDYVIHPVTGCQTNDHTKWLVNSNGYDYKILKENLLCCHSGPSACTCDIATYKIANDIDDDDKCLTVSFDTDANEAQFVLKTCEDWTSRGLGSWREVTYSSDEEKNWFQIENYGDVTEPMYMCLTAQSAESANGGSVGAGAKVVLEDCSLNQKIEINEWVSNGSKMKWSSERNQIMFVGNSESGELCLSVRSDDDNERDNAVLTLQKCSDATVFERSFTP